MFLEKGRMQLNLLSTRIILMRVEIMSENCINLQILYCGNPRTHVSPDIIDNLLCQEFSNYFTLHIDKMYNSISSKLSLLPQVDHTNDYYNLYSPNGMHLNKCITPHNPDIFNIIYTAKSSPHLDRLPLDLYKSIDSNINCTIQHY